MIAMSFDITIAAIPLQVKVEKLHHTGGQAGLLPCTPKARRAASVTVFGASNESASEIHKLNKRYRKIVNIIT